ncbi:hypothetical protein U1Q18_052043, partial [Sarracenia purpurea var. burkii]
MSVERSFEAWEEVQRQGQDLADRLAQGFTGLIQSHITDTSGINGVSAIFDIGHRLGQAGADFGACLNGVVQQFFRRLPIPFRHDENVVASLRTELNCQRTGGGITATEDLGLLAERFRDFGFSENDKSSHGSMDEETVGFNLNSAGLFGRPQ